MRRAYSYIRFSTPDQIKGDSLRRQLEKTESWCKRNNHILDDSLGLRDLGVSGFKNKNVETGRLGAFLQAVKDGRVERGSVLLIENLDRLTRTAIRTAVALFLSILDAGITIVTIEPVYRFEPEGQTDDMTQFLIAIISLSRGHGESARKSYLGGEAWKAKRKKIDQVKLTAKCPAWLKLNEDKTAFLTIPEKVMVVRRIFQSAISGLGLDAITKQLNGEGVKPLGYSSSWHKSYVAKILNNRSVLGEYQPHTGHGAKERKPIGEVVREYYPSIISEADFYRVQTALSSRRNKRGPIGSRVANLFTGVLRSAEDGGSMTIVDKGAKSSGKALVSSKATRGEKGSKYASFPYEAFETALVEWTKEIQPEDVLPGSKVSSVTDELVAAQGRLGDLDVRLTTFRDSLANDPDFRSLLEVVRTLETERAELVARIEQLKAEQAAAGSRPLDHTQDLVKLLATTEGEELIDLRTRLKAAYANLIAEIWVVVQVSGKIRQALVQVHFKAGGYRRLIVTTLNGELYTRVVDPIIRTGEPGEMLDLRNMRQA